MRSARKFSVNPISAMPGRLMSLSVIGTRDSRSVDRSSRESCSFCCSKSCATVRVGGLVEFKQPHPAVAEPIGDPEALPIPFLEDEDRLLARDQRPCRFVNAENRALRPQAHDVDL